MTEFYQGLGEWLGKDPFFTLLEWIGTFAGAMSGVRLASVKRFDWFGAYVIGFVTALGGGTLRDMMLGMRPFWMSGPSYIVVTFLAVVAVSIFGRRFIDGQVTWFIFDTISISFFMVIGLEKTLFMTSHPWWVAMIMGVITAVFGGVLRDICINQVPLIFRKEIYALACAAGGVAYLLLNLAEIDRRICATVCMVVIFVVRALAIKYHLGVPVLTGRVSKMLQHHGAPRHRHGGGRQAGGEKQGSAR